MTKSKKYSKAFITIMFFVAFSSNAKQQTIDWINLTQEQYVDKLIECKITLDKLNWSYSVWPKENKHPKPVFEEIVDTEQIRKSVVDNLRKQEILEDFFNYEITPAMIQNDMNRMAQDTKDANRLKQMFAALNNEPRTIAECISTPYLVQNRLASQYNFNKDIHAEVKLKAVTELNNYLATNKISDLSADVYTVTYKLKQDNPDNPNEFNEQHIIELDEKEFQQIIQTLEISNLQENENAFIYSKIIYISKQNTKVQVLKWNKQNIVQWIEEQSDAQHSIVFDEITYEIPDISKNIKMVNTTGLSEVWDNKIYLPQKRHDHTAIWTGTEMIIWGGLVNNYPNYKNGAKYNPTLDSWSSISLIGAPNVGDHHSAIWTGTKMIIWGGDFKKEGGKYNPNDDTWEATDMVFAPTGRMSHTVVWTGTEMIVWGGIDRDYNKINSGGKYNPTTNSWNNTNSTNSPEARVTHSAIWTGTEMIIWGGLNYNFNRLNTGSRYNPQTNTWIALNNVNAPAGRDNHSAIWTGTEMIIWGGFNLNTGGKYNPLANSWTAINNTNAPIGRYNHSAIWTGTKMIIWGGLTGLNSGFLNTGAMYNPVNDSWVATNVASAPTARKSHTAIWSGSEMVIWGGENDETLNTGSKYNPQTNSWVSTNIPNTPTARKDHSAIWTGNDMIIWGGIDDYDNYLNDGWKYNPTIDTWLPIDTSAAPNGSSENSSIWTGTEMIIMSGINGGKYNPILDSWETINTQNAPATRYKRTAIWTGTEMIIWGGHINNTNFYNNGSKYNPVTDSWIETNIITAPDARAWHTAIWTGSEMVVWGGWNGESLNSGGRYNPTSDSWTDINMFDAPGARYSHTAVWSGQEMIVWGGSNFGIVFSGKKYNPISDSWADISQSFAPYIIGFTTIWTGTEMIVWGGNDRATIPSNNINEGAKYNPMNDMWNTTSMNNAPVERERHTAVWTGEKMIVWGGESTGVTTNSMGIYYSNELIYRDGFE